MLQNPHDSINLEDLLNKLPKEVLVEQLCMHIGDSPVNEGIRAFRSLNQTLARMLAQDEESTAIEPVVEPIQNYINLMFDLHDEIENVLENDQRQLRELKNLAEQQEREIKTGKAV